MRALGERTDGEERNRDEDRWLEHGLPSLAPRRMGEEAMLCRVSERLTGVVTAF